MVSRQFYEQLSRSIILLDYRTISRRFHRAQNYIGVIMVSGNPPSNESHAQGNGHPRPTLAHGQEGSNEIRQEVGLNSLADLQYRDYGAGESFHSGPSPYAYLSDTHATAANPYLNQDYGPNSMTQPTFTSPVFQAPGHASANPPWDGSWYTGAIQGSPLRPANTYGQHDLIDRSASSQTNPHGEYFPPATIDFLPFAVNSLTVTTHTAAKSFPCPSCGKVFTRNGDMKRHEGVHGGPSIWCGFRGCNKGFYRKDKLKDHQKSHGIY